MVARWGLVLGLCPVMVGVMVTLPCLSEVLGSVGQSVRVGAEWRAGDAKGLVATSEAELFISW